MSAFVEILINKESEKEILNYNSEEHINKMKALYGDEWYWYVDNTDNDCELADRYRQWFYKKGVHPDFNIHTESQKDKIVLPKIILTDEDWLKTASSDTDDDEEVECLMDDEDVERLMDDEDVDDEDEIAIEIANAEAWENSEEKKEHDYVLRMECLYGKEWCWCVADTNDDCEIAEKYRDWDYETLKMKYPKEFSQQFEEEDMKDENENDAEY